MGAGRPGGGPLEQLAGRCELRALQRGSESERAAGRCGGQLEVRHVGVLHEQVVERRQ